MKWYGLRARVLLATVVPVTLVAFALSVAFVMGRLGDIERAQGQQELALVRQLASAAEFGVFAGATEGLARLVDGAMREPDVLGVVIYDLEGRALAHSGVTTRSVSFRAGNLERSVDGVAAETLFLSLPIVSTAQPLADLFDASGKSSPANVQTLGHVVVEFSRDALRLRQRELLWIGLAVTVCGWLLGLAFALHIGRGVVRPVLHLSRNIERIGKGEFANVVEVAEGDPLRELQAALSDMASRLARGRDQLQSQVALATLELRQKKDEAETATAAKSRFLAAASHDLRQPAHALGLFVARLAQLPADDATRELVHGVEASVSALQDMLDALLDLSRLESDSVQIRLADFPLQNLFDQLNHAFAASAAAKGIRLRVRSSSLWLRSDPILLSRVLHNLVGNAIRYTPAGSVLVACRHLADPGQVRIEVWDSGVGIATAHHASVFDEFFQIGNSERDRYKGLGLGLSIVDRSCRLLQHSLTMRSAPGCGSRFGVSVMAVAASKEEAPGQDITGLPGGEVAGMRVLLIEDDRLGAVALAGLLESWGCKVHHANDPAHALSLVRYALHPDVIISDFRLPGGQSGLEAVRLLRELLGVEIPALLISGDTDIELLRMAKEAGLVLLHKPVRPAKLRALLRRIRL